MSEHFVSDKPFDPLSVEQLTPEQEKIYLASQWKLMWLKLKRHRLAVVSSAVLLLIYIGAIFCEFLTPYNLHTRNTNFIYAPPQAVHLFHEVEFIGPFVYGYDFSLNLENLQREYVENPDDIQKIRFFCSGDEYKFWGMIESNKHFYCPAEGGQFFLFGADRLGRDMYSRIFYGARISLTIGLFGIVVSFILGIVIGGIAGYYGGLVDNLIQRFIEILKSFPETAPVDGPVRSPASHLEPDAGIFRYHHYPCHARLDRPGSGGEVQAVGPERRRLLHCGTANGGQTETYNRQTPVARIYEPLDCIRIPFNPGHDSR